MLALPYGAAEMAPIADLPCQHRLERLGPFVELAQPNLVDTPPGHDLGAVEIRCQLDGTEAKRGSGAEG